MVHKKIFEKSLPRLINMFNLDPLSPTFGFGDRQYASWKTIDFANGTFQGAVHSLASAYKLGSLTDKHKVFQLLEAAVNAIPKIRHRNGSMVEAYPNEHSFCVTALVAFDVLSALDILKEELPEDTFRRYLKIIKPLIEFISKNDEEHAIISNHLATGVAAIALWNDLSRENNLRWKELLKIIYDNQSEEGWYKEYEGADPGYQTLCTYYLAAAWKKLKDEQLLASLKKSLQFLKYFVHPDGSIGGLYGSRNTEVYYPGGLLSIATELEDASLIAHGLNIGFKADVHITPDMIDAWNFIPLINSYAMASMYESQIPPVNSETKLPFKETFEKNFSDAGIYIRSNESYYCIINYKKGGTIKIFNKRTNELDFEDGGICGILSNSMKFSSQSFNTNEGFANNSCSNDFTYVSTDHPGPFQFALLRIMALTIFRSTALGNMFKSAIVKMLMTGKKKSGGTNRRTFIISDSKVEVRDEIKGLSKGAVLLDPGKFKAIHMASSGYNSFSSVQKTPKRSLVSFVRN